MKYAGDHCVTACTFHEDGNQYHWCTTALGKDPHKPGRRWDYCTPSQFTAVPETQPESESEGAQVGDGDDSASSRPEHGAELTALFHQTECTCKKHEMAKSSVCSLVTASRRVQMDSVNQLQPRVRMFTARKEVTPAIPTPPTRPLKSEWTRMARTKPGFTAARKKI